MEKIENKFISISEPPPHTAPSGILHHSLIKICCVKRSVIASATQSTASAIVNWSGIIVYLKSLIAMRSIVIEINKKKIV